MRRSLSLLVLAATASTAFILPPRLAAPPDDAAPEGRWLAGDLHVHTTHSHDSYGGPHDENTGHDEAYTAGWSVEQQFANAAARGLGFLAITDHNDVRSQSDDGFGAHGVLPIRGYEKSLDGHAQMLGAGELYEVRDLGHDGRDAKDVQLLADELRRAGGVFQINHPASEDASDPDHLDWALGTAVVPDTVEVWNISRAWQPPMPSATSNAGAVALWERFLDAGHHVAATGGSDNHYVATSGVQGVGQPTTWVYVTEVSEAGVLDALRAGRTSISHQPPALGGPRLFLEADDDGDGTYEAMVGDTVTDGATVRVRVEGATPGAIVRIVTTGGVTAREMVVTSPSSASAVDLPGPVTWVRAELLLPEAIEVRRGACDPVVGDGTTYCRDEAAILAMTSALYVAS